VHPGPPPHV
jgi:hypothetical protein